MTDEEKIIDLLRAKPYVVFAYLFGSRQKGHFNVRSDWDLAVYFSALPDELGEWTVFALEGELSRAVGAVVQVIALNEIESPLLGYEIVSGGRILISRDEDILLDVTCRLLRRYHDWQYFQKRHIGHRIGHSDVPEVKA